MKLEIRLVQIIITLGVIIFYIIHYVNPKITLDFTTLVLLTIFLVIWVAPMIKLELPGNIKMQFHDLEKVTGSLEDVGLLLPKKKIGEQNIHDGQKEMKADNPWHVMTNGDSNLALATLRIETEKKLRQLAAKNNIPIQDANVEELCTQLLNKNIITRPEEAVLLDLIHILNNSVRMEHAGSTDKILQWVNDIGPQLLETLDKKLVQA